MAASAMDGPKKKRNRKYGSSRKSVLRKTLKQEQVTFTAPVSDDPVVAIIGGGISGLLCALQLEIRGIRSTVFDTGVHGLGGRLGTRTVEPSMIFDHAAQFFTVSNPVFSDLVDQWSQKGFVRQSEGVIGDLEAGGHFSPLPSSPPRYIAVDGMRILADSLLLQSSMIEVVRPCWISSIEPYNGMWHLSENGKNRGQFDAIVIAHNGKCANHLLSSSGLPLIARQMKRLEISSIWALLAAFEDPLPLPAEAAAVPFEGAFVKGIESVSWIGNNTQKLYNSQNGGPHCWTVFSTASFGKRNKVPQENIPTATAEKVKELMLAGVENALGLSTGSLKSLPAAAYMLQDQEAHAAQNERTFIAIKPDGVQRGLISEIIARFERKGFKLVAIKLVTPTKSFAQQHYHDLKERPFFNGLCDFLSSGPVLAMVWEGEGVIKYGRKLIGATDPQKSEPGTIRGDLAVVVGRNIIHGSDGPETAKDEINLWFKPEEVTTYTSNQEKWVYGDN